MAKSVRQLEDELADERRMRLDPYRFVSDAEKAIETALFHAQTSDQRKSVRQLAAHIKWLQRRVRDLEEEVEFPPGTPRQLFIESVIR